MEGEKAQRPTAGSNPGIPRFDLRRIEVLPPSDGNPFTLARRAPGVILAHVLVLRLSRSFDHNLAFTPGITGEVLNASS